MGELISEGRSFSDLCAMSVRFFLACQDGIRALLAPWTRSFHARPFGNLFWQLVWRVTSCYRHCVAHTAARGTYSAHSSATSPSPRFAQYDSQSSAFWFVRVVSKRRVAEVAEENAEIEWIGIGNDGFHLGIWYQYPNPSILNILRAFLCDLSVSAFRSIRFAIFSLLVCEGCIETRRCGGRRGER